jgi:PAS domain S-box-containing protein
VNLYGRDITERKRAEEALRASELRYRTLFEMMTEGFSIGEIICDAAGKPCDLRYLSVNPAFERQTGLKAADILGRTTLELFPDAEPVWFERFGRVALAGESAHFEAWFGPLGRCYEVSAYRTEPGRFAVVFFDITERKRAEEALRESEQRFRLALQNAPVSVAAQDRDLRFLWAYNQRTVDSGAVIGKTDTDLFPPEDAARLIALKRKVLETETEMREELWLTSGGKRVFLDLYLEPMRDAAGQVAGIGIATVDHTPMKLVEEELRVANEELTRFNNAMVERELRMIELKQEVNELCQQAGQPPRYPLDFRDAKL